MGVSGLRGFLGKCWSDPVLPRSDTHFARKEMPKNLLVRANIDGRHAFSLQGGDSSFSRDSPALCLGPTRPTDLWFPWGLSTFHQLDSSPVATFSTLPFDQRPSGSRGDLAHFTSLTQPPVATFSSLPFDQRPSGSRGDLVHFTSYARPPVATFYTLSTDLLALVYRHSGRTGCF